MLTRVEIAAGVWFGLLIFAGVGWIVFHEVAWRLHQRRRRRVPMEFWGRRL